MAVAPVLAADAADSYPKKPIKIVEPGWAFPRTC
jgi:hypothetical protein